MDQFDQLVIEKIISFLPDTNALDGARHVFDHISPRLAHNINTRALVARAVRVAEHQRKVAEYRKKQDMFCRGLGGNFESDDEQRGDGEFNIYVKEGLKMAGFSPIGGEGTVDSFIQELRKFASGIDENVEIVRRIVTESMKTSGLIP